MELTPEQMETVIDISMASAEMNAMIDHVQGKVEWIQNVRTPFFPIKNLTEIPLQDLNFGELSLVLYIFKFSLDND